MREVLSYYAPRIAASDVLDRLKLSPRKYFLASAHREENVDDPENLADLLASLDAVARRHRQRVIVSTHPRTRKRISSLKRTARPEKVEFMKAMGFADYVKLQQNATCVLSDSGTLTEESSILDFPAVMIRQSHERPEGMDEGALIMCGLKPERVLDAIGVTLKQRAAGGASAPPDYAPQNVSRKVLRIIMSYVDYVNRTVWMKR
jgi:UDP-N-acetylglucosamine 2-epimerase (non-hydrolysing)